MSQASTVSGSSSSSWLSTSNVDSKSNAGRSQAHWKLFRRNVLAPHHIRIVETINGSKLPETILTWVEANRNNTARFDKQRKIFRDQVEKGRGFGSSALFPMEVLPSIDSAPFIARCMVPTLSYDALPERRMKQGATNSVLSLPRPGLGYGFSPQAFGAEEINAMPGYLLATGTTVDFETGCISSGTALYCPFYNFERAFSQQEHGLETATGSCAIDGAWCCRSLQMLYAKASGEDGQEVFDAPISFSCCIDNTIAIIQYHWVDHAQTYCTAPVIKFDLTKDDHFDQFLLWTEAITQWALNILLPEIKRAIALLGDYVSALPALVKSLRMIDMSQLREEESLVSALKLSYSNIPWKLDDASPVSSSTASWGSPMITEATFAKFDYPIIPQPKHQSMLVKSDNALNRFCSSQYSQPDNTNQSCQVARARAVAPSIPGQTEDIAYTPQNRELYFKRRLSHAVDEIASLQQQLSILKQELSGSTTCLQNEISGLRKTMSCVIRKEKLNFRQRPTLPIQSASVLESESNFGIKKNVGLVTTPTDPQAAVNWPRPAKPMPTPSGLKNCLTLDTDLENEVEVQRHISDPKVVVNSQSPVTIYSPTVVQINNTIKGDIHETLDQSHGNRGSWPSIVFSCIVGALTPSAMFRVLLLGCMVDYVMVSAQHGHALGLTQYVSKVFQGVVY